MTAWARWWVKVAWRKLRGPQEAEYHPSCDRNVPDMDMRVEEGGEYPELKR